MLSKAAKMCCKHSDSIYKYSFVMVGSILTMFGVTLAAKHGDHAWSFLLRCSPILTFCILLCTFTVLAVNSKSDKR